MQHFAADGQADGGRAQVSAAARGEAGEEGLWRLSLEAVDGWKVNALDAAADDDRGPFARLLGA